MNFSQKTQDLINRQCRNVERADFRLNKLLAEELIMKTYDLFNLPRPKKVKWCVDLEDKEFASSASSAWSASSASSASSALDHEFNWFIFTNEYFENPNNDLLPNDNDLVY